MKTSKFDFAVFFYKARRWTIPFPVETNGDLLSLPLEKINYNIFVKNIQKIVKFYKCAHDF